MKLRMLVFGTTIFVSTASLAFYIGIMYRSASPNALPDGSGAMASTAPVSGTDQVQAVEAPSAPPSSGNSYHAIDLLTTRPFPDQGELVVLDVAASPTVADGRVLHYATYPGHIPAEAYAHGVSFKQMLGANVCIYDAIEQVPGDGRTVPDSAGQIAVEIQTGMVCPSAERLWDAEPNGVEEVTLNDGTVKQLPKVRFWSYHLSQ